MLAGRGWKSESASFKMLNLPLICFVTGGKSNNLCISVSYKINVM